MEPSDTHTGIKAVIIGRHEMCSVSTSVLLGVLLPCLESRVHSRAIPQLPSLRSHVDLDSHCFAVVMPGRVRSYHQR